jgi:hypothetical protein
MKRLFIGISIVLVVGLLALPALAKVPMGNLYYNGNEVRTLIPPSAMPNEGRDNLYEVPDQLGVAAVAPGDTDYHGGAWAVYIVTWNVSPYLLTSEAAVLAAGAAGDITITRDPTKDFRCPIQGQIPK